MTITIKDVALFIVILLVTLLAFFNLYSLYFYTLSSINMWFQHNHAHPEIYVLLLLGQTAGCWGLIGFIIGRFFKPKCCCK